MNAQTAPPAAAGRTPRHLAAATWCVVVLVLWSALEVVVTLGLSRSVVHVGGVTVVSWSVPWVILVPAAVGLACALGALLALRAGQARTATFLLLGAAVTGIVGLVGLALSVVALVLLWGPGPRSSRTT